MDDARRVEHPTDLSPSNTNGNKQARYRRTKGQQARYLSEATTTALIDPPRMTAKQAKFAEILASGVTHGDARKQAGISSGAAHRALQNAAVQQYLSVIRSESRAIAAYDLATAMQEALDVIAFAKKHENAMAYCKAVELRAKLSGLLIDRVEVFSMDLKGAIEKAEHRVLTVIPPAASTQLTQAPQQAVP